MIDQILNFFKNKYFLITLALLVVFIAIYQFLDYQNRLKNDDEFKKLISFNEKVIIEETDFNELMEESDKFTIFGYKLIVKSLLAQKAIENENLISARNIYNQLYIDGMNSNLGRDSRSIINSEIIENIIRINIQLDDFEEGKKFINSLEQNQRNHELEGDFYKYFKKFDEANNSYDKALEEETDEGKVNFIRLKKVYSND